MWMLGEGQRTFDNKDPCDGIVESTDELIAEFLSEDDEDYPVEAKHGEEHELTTLDNVDDLLFGMI